MLFVNEPNAMALTWTGYRMGSKNVPKMLGIQAAAGNETFEAALAQLEMVASRQGCSEGPPDATGSILGMVTTVNKFVTDKGFTKAESLRLPIRQMRAIKSPARIARSSTSSSNLKHTRSASITTTPRVVKASTST